MIFIRLNKIYLLTNQIIFRWKKDDSGKKLIEKDNLKPILEFVSIQRLDTKKWAYVAFFDYIKFQKFCSKTMLNT